MATGSWTLEMETPVAASRLFRATVMDWHNLAPKLVPEIITSAHSVKGEGTTVGSITHHNFTSVMPFSSVKEHLDFIDVEKRECKKTLLEGGGIGMTIKSATLHTKVEAAANGGSVLKVVTTYKLLPGVDESDVVAKAKESFTSVFKTAEAYLVANPDAYN